MTRRSRRELERAIDDISDGHPRRISLAEFLSAEDVTPLGGAPALANMTLGG